MLTIDPALFTDDAISDETRAFNARFEAELSALPPTHTVPVELTRKARDEGRGLFPSGGPLDGSDWVEIPGAPGTGRVRVSRAPGRPRGLVLHIHGGGWSLGRPCHFDRQCQGLARDAGVTVVSVEYRLAPEHPWPAQREDCLAAAKWLMGAGAERFGADRVAIVGESAGAHLAACSAIALRDLKRSEPLAGLVLNYGCFDLTLTPSMARWGERQLVLSTPTVQWFVDNLDPKGHQRTGAGLSPLKADLKGLPPALFQIGTMDPLLDDSLMMASRWSSAGNRAELAVYPGGIHAFDQFDLAIAREFHARQAAFVASLFA
ncbi:MAG: alpha/beta hydrolase [Rubricella sp.]